MPEAARKTRQVPTDIEIAQKAKIRPILEIAEELGIDREFIEPYGWNKCKVSLAFLDKIKDKPQAKYIDVTAITPTPLGEGKTVTTIGLSMGLKKIGKRVCTGIRQPSLGPVFGIKGGAAGGGYSQVVPMDDFNLHLTGDTHAVSLAHNLLAAFVDNHIFHGNQLGLDPQKIQWRRVVDVSDRALRNIIVALGGEGVPRETGFDISVASEIMAILALTTGMKDIKERLSRMVVGETYDGKAVTAGDLKCAGSMTMLMKDAIKPNLMQTLEHTPCFVHAGPFANIAHGNSSVLSDMMGVRLADYFVTESGFASDLGMEKFMNIKCRASGLKPDCVVIVATVRALKMHGGLGKVVAGKPLPEELRKENFEALEKGCANLDKHVENALLHGCHCIVAVNRFLDDTDREIDFIRKMAKKAGAYDAVPSEVWMWGGDGGKDLATAVVEACKKPSNFKFLYELDWPIKKKIETIATKIYGAAGVEFLPEANRKIKKYNEWGFDKLPICMAKTHLSLSHDPNVKGRPKDYVVPIRDVRASVGAGFLYPLLGEMRTMPGLPHDPVGAHYDITEDGSIIGLS